MMNFFSIAVTILVISPMGCVARETNMKANYKADCMSRGCTVYDVKKELGKIDGSLYQMISWNIKDENIKDVCSIFSEMHLAVINLQGVTDGQINELTSNCLQTFKVSGLPKTRSDSNLMNPIFYSDKIRMIEDGVTNEDSEKCPSMSWTWLSLHDSNPGTQRQQRLVRKSFSENLFAILSGETILRRARSQIVQTHHLKKVRFVNARLDDGDRKEMTTECMRVVRYVINGRRRYRTLLSGFGPEEESAILDYPNRSSHKIFKHCAPEETKEASSKICISNRSRRDTFQYKLTALIQTNSARNPTFVAFSI